MRPIVVDVPGAAAVVLDSPHSGVFYPDDFRHCCDFAMLRGAQDTHVEKLYDFAPAMGVAWIEAIEAAHAGHGYSIHVNCHSMMPAVASQFGTVRCYGDPARDRHGVQVEVNRRLYMDEKTLEPPAGFDRLRSDLKEMVAMLLETDPRSLG